MGVDNTECTAWSHLFHLSVEWIIGSADHIRHREFLRNMRLKQSQHKSTEWGEIKKLNVCEFQISME